MRLDDLARQAAAQAREQAARAGNLDPEAYRGTRQRRAQRRGILVAGVFVTAALVVAIVVSPPEEDLAAPSTTSLPGVVSTTAPSVTTTTRGPEPSTGEIVIGTGWEELDGSPVQGQAGLAGVWTGSELFVWGGHDGSVENWSSAERHHGAHLYDPDADSWRATSEPPEGLCLLTRESVVWIGDSVVVRGYPLVRDDCKAAARYFPQSDSWTLIESDFFGRVPPGAGLAWTGELLVAPQQGLAWAPDSDYAYLIPPAPETTGLDAPDDDPLTPENSIDLAHWTGERVITIGAGDAYVWSPGDTEWTRIQGPPIPSGGRRSIWTDDGLWVAHLYGEAAMLDLNDVWHEDSLPLRLYECPVDMVAAGDLAVVRLCSGLVIRDPIRGFWVPIPLDVLLDWTWRPTLVGADDAIYSLGEKVLRYPIERLGDGSVANPPTIPVGVMQLDMPPGFWLRSAVGLTQTEWPDGSYGEVVAFAFEAPRGTCHVAARYGGPEITVDASVIVYEIEVPLPWFTFHDGESDAWVIVSGDSDSIWIDCDSEEDAQLLIDGRGGCPCWWRRPGSWLP